MYQAIQNNLSTLLEEGGFSALVKYCNTNTLSELSNKIQGAVASAPEPKKTNRYPLTEELKVALGID
jgi:hypothetical protein